MGPAPRLRGVVPPMATPRLADGSVDRASLSRLVRFQIDGGVDALWILGSCGEFYLLTDHQRQEVIETSLEAAAGDVPVLVGCIETSPDRSIEWGRRASAAGAHAIFITAPIYLPTSQAEILAHCRRVRDGVDLPLVLYNAQFATQTPVENETIRTLAEEGTLGGLKDSAGDWGAFRQLVIDMADLPFAIVTGNELMMDAALLIGAHGAVASTANVIPEVYAAIYRAAQQGNWAEAGRLQNMATQVNAYAQAGDSAGTFVSRDLTGMKTALKVRGVIDHAYTGRPLMPPTADEEARVRAILARYGVEPVAVPA